MHASSESLRAEFRFVHAKTPALTDCVACQFSTEDTMNACVDLCLVSHYELEYVLLLAN